MSRAGFSIRKLINHRRTGSGSDDEKDEEAFECSSAKTIRMQYELEQYQLQQLQKDGRHQLKERSPLVSGGTSPRRTGHRRVPKPITVVRNSKDGVKSHDRSSSRGFSSPLASSGLPTGRLSPTMTPARSSHESLCSSCGVQGISDHQCQKAIKIPRRAAQGQLYLFPRSLPTAISSRPDGTPKTFTRRPSYEKPSTTASASVYSSSPESRILGHGDSSAQNPAPISIYNRSTHTRTSSVKTSADSAINMSRSPSGTSAHTPQRSAFINGQPSPPLDPEDQVQGRLRAISPQPRLATGTESTWFLSDAEEERVVMPDNVQRLIKETDEAFKAVGSTLAHPTWKPLPPPPTSSTKQHKQLQQAARFIETQDSSSSMSPLPILQATTYQGTSVGSLAGPLSPTAGAGRGTFAPTRKGHKSSPLSPSSAARRSPSRGSSISKSKKAPKSPVAGAARPTALDVSLPSAALPGSPARSSRHHHSMSYQRSLARLNLAADKVTDKFFDGRGGRLGFTKIEADEVVTPEQVELFRQARLAKAQAEAGRAASVEIVRGADGDACDEGSSGTLSNEDLSETSGSSISGSPAVIGTLSLQSFSTIDKETARYRSNIVVSKAATQTKEISTGQNLLVTPPATPPQLPATFPAQTANEEDEDSMHLPNIAFPKLSSRRPTHKRGASSSSLSAPLPTIPEVRFTASSAYVASPGSQKARNGAATQTSSRPQTPERSIEKSPYFDEDDEHMFFESTPLTSTMPAFQHGRIRLAKADLVNAGTINSLESRLLTSPDEKLDWTAFQMAILGGAGELFSDPDNFLSRDAQEEMVDDLCDWLEDIGFSNQNLGSLKTRDERPKGSASTTRPSAQAQAAAGRTGRQTRKTSRDVRGEALEAASQNAYSSVGDAQPGSGQETTQAQSMPIPITSEHPSGFWNTRPFDASRFLTGEECGIKRWTLEGHPKRYTGPGIDVSKANTLARSNSDLGGPVGRPHGETTTAAGVSRNVNLGVGSLEADATRASILSLPQSPMLDLRMTTAVDGSKEFVPMGYNLGHDLGDFLKWEAEHVYASGFYGAD